MNDHQTAKAAFISGKKILLFIFQLQPFLLEMKETETTESELSSIQFSTHLCNFQRRHAPDVLVSFHREYSHIKGIAAVFSSERCLTNSKWKKHYTILQKAISSCTRFSEVSFGTTVIDYLEWVWFISPSVKKFKANFLHQQQRYQRQPL